MKRKTISTARVVEDVGHHNLLCRTAEARVHGRRNGGGRRGRGTRTNPRWVVPANTRSCRFIGAMMRSLCLLLGGLGTFLGGRNVVMVLLRGLGRVLRSLSWMSYYSSSITLLGLLVHYLLVHFLFGTVLHVLQARPHLASACVWTCCWFGHC